jgi:TonB family protein
LAKKSFKNFQYKIDFKKIRRTFEYWNIKLIVYYISPPLHLLKKFLMKTFLLFLTLLLSVCSPSIVQAQDAEVYNRVDASNHRQGPWRILDNNLNLALECNYVDDRPVGLLKYYRNNVLVLELELTEKREKFLWTYHDGQKQVKGYSLADKNRTMHYFENGQKLTADQIMDILSNYETEVAFEGGHEGLQAYLAENLNFPEKLRKKGIQGDVYASFVVNKTGGVRDIKIVRGVDELLDQEAIRLIQQMPKWTPATFRGYTKESRHNLIIPFKNGEAVAGVRE